MRIGRPVIYLACLFTVAGAAPLTGLLPTGIAPQVDRGEGLAIAAGPAVLPQLEGTWAGSWTDTVYNVSGDLDFVIWSEGNSYAATGTIDVTAISGALGVLSGGATGTDNGTSLAVDFDCTSLGNGSVTLTTVAKGGVLAADAVGSGTVTAPLNFGAFTLTGTATDSDMGGAFDFTSPGGGKGIAQLTKTSVPVQPTSWGSVKAAYGGP